MQAGADLERRGLGMQGGQDWAMWRQQGRRTILTGGNSLHPTQQCREPDNEDFFGILVLGILTTIRAVCKCVLTNMSFSSRASYMLNCKQQNAVRGVGEW